MGYPKDLDDYTTEQLVTELQRRERLTRQGRCWYCLVSLKAHSCRLACK